MKLNEFVKGTIQEQQNNFANFIKNSQSDPLNNEEDNNLAVKKEKEENEEVEDGNVKHNATHSKPIATTQNTNEQPKKKIVINLKNKANSSNSSNNCNSRNYNVDINSSSNNNDNDNDKSESISNKNTLQRTSILQSNEESSCITPKSVDNERLQQSIVQQLSTQKEQCLTETELKQKSRQISSNVLQSAVYRDQVQDRGSVVDKVPVQDKMSVANGIPVQDIKSVNNEALQGRSAYGGSSQCRPVRREPSQNGSARAEIPKNRLAERSFQKPVQEQRLVQEQKSAQVQRPIREQKPTQVQGHIREQNPVQVQRPIQEQRNTVSKEELLREKQIAEERILEELFLKSETQEQYREKWFDTLNKARNGTSKQKKSYVFEKISKGRFTIRDDKIELLPEYDTAGKSSKDMLGDQWLPI